MPHAEHVSNPATVDHRHRDSAGKRRTKSESAPLVRPPCNRAPTGRRRECERGGMSPNGGAALMATLHSVCEGAGSYRRQLPLPCHGAVTGGSRPPWHPPAFSFDTAGEVFPRPDLGSFSELSTSRLMANYHRVPVSNFGHTLPWPNDRDGQTLMSLTLSRWRVQ